MDVPKQAELLLPERNEILMAKDDKVIRLEVIDGNPVTLPIPNGGWITF